MMKERVRYGTYSRCGFPYPRGLYTLRRHVLTLLKTQRY